MLAAADWVIYAIPLIAFLVWLLSTAMRSAQPPAARPNRPRGNEPVVHPEHAPAQRVEEIPVVQPVQSPAGRRDRLEEFLERRRRERSAPARPARPRRPHPVVVVPEPRPAPTSPREVVVEPAVVLPPSAVVQQPPAAAPPPSAGRGVAMERRPGTVAEFRPPLSVEALRRGPAPGLVLLSRFLERREDLQAAFLLRELLGPPKALHWLARGRPP